MTTVFEPSPAIEPAPWARRPIHLYLSAATFPLAAAVFIAHVAHAPGFGDEHRVNWIAIWLIALGCIGCPVYGLRLLGHSLTVRTCIVLAAAFGSAAVLLTILFAVGDIPITVANQDLALVIPMAIAIQAYNAGEARAAQLLAARRTEADCEQRIAEAALTQCQECALRDQIAVQTAKLNALQRFEHLSPQEVADLVDAILSTQLANPNPLD